MFFFSLLLCIECINQVKRFGGLTRLYLRVILTNISEALSIEFYDNVFKKDVDHILCSSQCAILICDKLKCFCLTIGLFLFDDDVFLHLPF